VTEPRKKTGNLDKLDPIDQDLVYSHCEPAGMTLLEGVEWIKDTYGIVISMNRLSVWLRKHRVARSNEGRLEKLREARDSAMLIGRVVGTATGITNANSTLIAQAVFEELGKAPGERNEERLVAFMELGLKAKREENRAAALRVIEEKFRFDAAAAALKAAGELQAINASGGDEREKVKRAITVLFGEGPDDSRRGAGNAEGEA
jgi:hypothetical protein